MVKVGRQDTLGFEIDDFRKNVRIYELPSSQAIIAKKHSTVLTLELATASNLNYEDHETFFRALDYASSINLDVEVAVDICFNDAKAREPERHLVKKLQKYDNIIKGNYLRFFSCLGISPDFITLAAVCPDPDKF